MKHKIRKLTILRSRKADYNRNIPAITLQGVWFKEWGFYPGDKIEIQDKGNGVIVIRKVGSIISCQ